jgi:hypothetical protein
MPRTAVSTGQPNPVLRQRNSQRYDRANGGAERRNRDGRHDRNGGGGGHWITEPSLKMGRYMATTRPPMTTPRNRITIGSMRAIMLLTVWSTSES